MFQELEDIFGDSNRPVTFEDIQNMKYMDQVVHEAWRLYPPIPLIAKQPTTDIELGKYLQIFIFNSFCLSTIKKGRIKKIKDVSTAWQFGESKHKRVLPPKFHALLTTTSLIFF